MIIFFKLFLESFDCGKTSGLSLAEPKRFGTGSPTLCYILNDQINQIQTKISTLTTQRQKNLQIIGNVWFKLLLL